jgi:hypothetical protein
MEHRGRRALGEPPFDSIDEMSFPGIGAESKDRDFEAGASGKTIFHADIVRGGRRENARGCGSPSRRAIAFGFGILNSRGFERARL